MENDFVNELRISLKEKNDEIRKLKLENLKYVKKLDEFNVENTTANDKITKIMNERKVR